MRRTGIVIVDYTEVHNDRDTATYAHAILHCPVACTKDSKQAGKISFDV